MQNNGNGEPTVSRREFLKTLGIAGASGGELWSGRPLAFNLHAANASSELPVFEEIPPSVSGITWVHRNGRSPEFYLPETLGGGGGFIDYDNDGWMDIYFVNSGKCGFYDPHPPLRNALYRNNRDGTFTDVTEKAGVAGGGFGQGLAVGDYDGDGWPDLYVTQYGQSILYHNNRDGTFTDVTQKAGLAAPGWASSAAWFDYDNDGRLDLFVCRSVDFHKSNNQFCGNAPSGERYYCIPSVYPPMPCYLFHNNGDGTFTDVSDASGISSVRGVAWGVVATDINNDGLMDLFVSNDTMPNFLFANRGNGKFDEIGLQSGTGYSADGRARSGMGVDSADYDQDGWMDLFLTDVDEEMFSLYHNNHDETFGDESVINGIGMTVRYMSGWGVKFLDYDNDGNVDLFIVTGHPDNKVQDRYAMVTYKEKPMLWRNNGSGDFKHTYVNVSAQSGRVFQTAYAGRGLAVGDFNNDGGLDTLIIVNGGAPVLLRNNVGKRNHWLGVRLIGKTCNPDAVGAILTWQAGDLKRSMMKIAGGGYLSSHDPRMVLGIGARTQMDWLEVKWPKPSGKIERLTGLPIDRYITVEEGRGIIA
ncbi:MAG: CRTAC1 family protein [Terriglobia bacterium]